jgi:hypothetical protein
MRLNDVRDGTNKIDGILENYRTALERHGMIDQAGLYTSFFALKQKKAMPARHGAHTAWYAILCSRVI